MNFKLGDVCIIVNHADPPKFAGMECTITGSEDWYHGIGRHGPEPLFAFRVVLSDGFVAQVVRAALRLKRPPSWDKWLYDTSNVPREVTAESSKDGGKTWRTLA